MSERITEHGEVVEAEAIVVSEPSGGGMTLFGSDRPKEAMARMTEVAGVLAGVIEQKKLYIEIPDKKTGKVKKHVEIEGWTLLGSLLGVFPRTVSCDPVLSESGAVLGFKSSVEAVTRTGQVIGAATALCMRSEKRGPWAYAEDYALASMSQTRAASKALRLPLGFVMQLAGYEPLPSSEVPEGGFQNAQEPARAQGSARPGPAAAPPAKDALDERGRPKGHAYHECPSCHKEAVRVNPVEGAEPHAYCWKKAGGCGASYTTSLWAVVSVPGPSALDPPPRAARHEAPADDIDLTDDQNLPF